MNSFYVIVVGGGSTHFPGAVFGRIAGRSAALF